MEFHFRSPNISSSHSLVIFDFFALFDFLVIFWHFNNFWPFGNFWLFAIFDCLPFLTFWQFLISWYFLTISLIMTIFLAFWIFLTFWPKFGRISSYFWFGRNFVPHLVRKLRKFSLNWSFWRWIFKISSGIPWFFLAKMAWVFSGLDFFAYLEKKAWSKPWSLRWALIWIKFHILARLTKSDGHV